MIGLMPFTGSGESFPRAVQIPWEGTTYDADTFVGTYKAVIGRTYILITACNEANTYFTISTSGYSLVSRSGNITVHKVVANYSSMSVIGGRSGTGVLSAPVIYEVSNFNSITPTLSGVVTPTGTSAAVTLSLVEKYSLILAGLWLTAPRTVTAVSSAGDPAPLAGTTQLVGAGELETYRVEKVLAGSYTLTTSWTSSTSVRLYMLAFT